MFDLRENPFVVLGVTPRSTKADVNEAFEDALLDARDVNDERRLNLARQALFTPNERVTAELGYLLELRPSDARKALTSKAFEHWVEVAESTQGVARANALAEAMSSCTQTDACRSLTLNLLDCWSGINPKEIWQQVSEARSISDFGSIAEADIRRGLDRLRHAHAEKAIAHLEGNSDLPAVFTDLLEAEIIPNDRVREKFASALVTSYAQRTSGALAKAADRSLECLQDFVRSGSDQAFRDFENDLADWDRLAQPLQLASQTKGADEPHSQELYEKVRSHALTLANDEARHSDAARITRLAESIFAELPSAQSQLRQDSETLDEILEHSAKTQVLAPLTEAIAEAREDLFWTSQHLTTHGFVTSAPDPIGKIRRSFESLLTPDLPIELRDDGARILRGLAVELFNERQDILNAKSLTAYLASDGRWFSHEVNAQIAADDRELAKNLGMQHLQSAMKGGEWKRAKGICSELLALASGLEVSDLQNINQIIEEKIRSRRTSQFVWGGIAALVIGFLVFSDDKPSDYNPDYSYDSMSDSVEMPADSAVAAPSLPSTETDIPADTQEEVAPPYGGGSLSLPQLRYCIRQGERMDAARSMVYSYQQQSKFNAAVTDYNTRCGSFQYDHRDMATVRSEIDQVREQLNAEAAAIVGPRGATPSYRQPTYPGVGTGNSDTSDGYGLSSESSEADEAADPLNPYGERDEY
ncbi:MAG: hypothetical protein WBL20_06975 [Sphingobium sp.]|uniref:hypothetical protein n=1 Tax=Sphingobium sp. TaxID=1912891 RepID=UPI003BAECE25